ncbi:MAG TPA: TetR/AcrR family transcriptional regulator [Mycobacteriales bacterium]|jgi:AcrR family transcriptional regulator|nr:TetR/AcrR family transcriptional regulator [Mycobacteriales bacterium]
MSETKLVGVTGNLETCPDESPCGERRLRADARRNRAKVLAAAEEVLSKQGLDAPIDEIAHHAGVGVGTVYRHFPTKRELHEAVVHAHFDQLINIVEELLNSPDPGEAFFEYVDAVVRESAHKAVARAIAESDPEVRRRREEWMSALTQRSAELLRRSQNVGTIRKDVTYEDVRVVLGGLCMAYDRLALDPIQRDRSVALLRAALTDTKTPIG